MSDAWGTAWGASSAWGNTWGAGVAPPVVVATFPIGGSGYPGKHGASWKRKDLKKKVSEWVDEEVKALYREVVEEAPEAAEEAKAIVKPFVKKKGSPVRESTVDWGAMLSDVQALKALIDLQERKATERRRNLEKLLLMAIL